MAKLASASFKMYIGGGIVAFGSEKGCTVNMAHTPVDTTDKQSAGVIENLSGRRNWDMTCEGFYVHNDTSFLALETAFTNRTSVTVYIRDSANSKQWYGTAFITSLNLTSNDPDAVQQSISLQGTGAMTAVAAAY